jgi:hypothetical protein
MSSETLQLGLGASLDAHWMGGHAPAKGLLAHIRWLIFSSTWSIAFGALYIKLSLAPVRRLRVISSVGFHAILYVIRCLV